MRLVEQQNRWSLVPRAGAGALLLATVLVAAGCNNEVIVSDDDGTSGNGAGGPGGQGSGGQGGGGQGGGGQGGGGVTIDCQAACAGPSEPVCFDAAACDSLCATHNGSWIDSSAAAFSHCAANEALCFETLEGCLWRTLYPDPVPIDALVQGEGLFPFEGKTIYARLDGEAAPIEATVIQDGAFALPVSAEVYLDWAPSAILWIDANDDEVCDATDATAIGQLTLSPPFHAPAVAGTVELSHFKDGGFACSLL